MELVPVPGVAVDPIVNKIAYQLSCELKNQDMTQESIFSTTISIIQAWLRKKLKNNRCLFNKIANIKKDMSEEYGGIGIDTIYSENKWAFRFRHPDFEFPARTWTVQAVVFTIDNSVYLEVINMCSFQLSNDQFNSYSIPGFVRTIHEKIGMFDICRITDLSMEICNNYDYFLFENLLTDKRRKLPVVVITSDTYGDYSIYPDEMAKRAFGLAYIIKLPVSYAQKFTARVGRAWSVYNGAVRIYLTHIDFNTDEFYRHPLFIKDRIFNWRDGNRAFMQFLENYLKRYNAQASVFFKNTAIYLNARHEKIEQDILKAEKENQGDKELMQLYQEENESYRIRIEQLEQDIKGKEDDYLQIMIINDELRQEKAALLAKLNIYESIVRNNLFQESDIPIPDNWDDMDDWCRKYLPNKLVLSTKARQALKSAQYEDIELAYKALLLYANEYRDMRMRDSDNDEPLRKFNEKLDELGLENLGTPIAESRFGERSNIYTTSYDGEEYKIEHHIGKGVSHDPKYCLRVYATWDAVNCRVIIGSLPGHLDTRASN